MTTARTRDSLGPMAVLLAVVAGILFLYARLAHAGTDPTVAITSGVDTSLSVWTTDGPLWLAVAFAYVALRTFLSRQHWLSQGRVLAVLTGLAGIGAAVIGWHFQGAPSTGILTALLAAVALVQHPTVPPATARNPQAGVTRLLPMLTIAMVIAIGVGGGLVASCVAGSTARQATAAGVVAALDCELLHIDGDVMADARLFADAKVQGWISGVKPGDTAALQDRIAADLKPIKSDLGHCAIAGALAAATVVVVEHPGTVVSALSVGDPVQLRAAFAVAAREAGWAPVKIAGGVTL